VTSNSGVDVAVVVPSYGNFDVLLRCLDSVLASKAMPRGRIDVAVVTSGCTRAEMETLRDRGCRVLNLEHPVATSLSRNIGAESSDAEFLLFLDDDNTVAPDTIALLCRALLAWPDAAVVGPAMYYGAAPEKLWCAGVRRSRVLMKTTFRNQLPEPLPERLASEDFPNCFMVRRREFELVKGFDALRFPQHMEEADLTRRLAGATGGRAFLVPRARVWHNIELPLVRRLHLRNSDRAFLAARGRAMFTAVHGSSLQWTAYILAAQWMFGAFYLAAVLTLPRANRGRIFGSYINGMRNGIVAGWHARVEDRAVARASRAHMRS
jgi:GT2 family glycosyltransferase